MMSILYKVAEEGREIIFVQAVQFNSSYFQNELKALKAKYNNIKTAVFYQSPLESDKINEDFDVEGIATKEWLMSNLPKNGEFYFCGPLGFMKHIYNTAKEMGVSEDNINYEMFGPSADLATM
ncbi:MAG: hypothetical protein ACRDD2_02360 [Sarcina sp.]